MSSPSETGHVGAGGFTASSLSYTPPANFRASSLLASPRYRELDRRQSYYDCTQHDAKGYDFDGRIIGKSGSQQPLLTGEVASWYVPLKSRRPSTPHRLGRLITKAFTSMVYGSQRFPGIRCEGDPDTQDFATALVRASSLQTKMIRARNIGGAVGTVGLSWCYDGNGRPRIQVHNGKHLHVHSWEDREELVPRHVSEVYLYAKDEWDGSRRRFLRNWYWYRRDWLSDEDVTFKEVLYKPSTEPNWEPDLERSVHHDDGFTHFSWIQNQPGEEIDGAPDCEGLYEALDSLDIVLSVITRGGTLNLDPTLILKMDRDLVGAMGVKKGSDNALTVGEAGDAHYLEIAGSSLEAGLKLFGEMRRNILEVSQCIIPDPSEIAAQGVSSVALKTIFAPMLSVCDTFREQYGRGKQRVLDQMIAVARAKVGTKIVVWVEKTDADGASVKDEAGNPVQVQEERELEVNLPPRVVSTPVLDDMNQPVKDPETGDKLDEITLVPRKPGAGGEIELSWPQYFPATPDDQSKTVTTLSTAAGGKAVLSQQTAVEAAAAAFGHEPDEEWRRVQAMKETDDQQEIEKAKAFAATSDFAGGAVDDPEDMPEGAEPKGGGPPGAPPGKGGGFPPKKAPPFGGAPGAKKPPPFGK